MGAGQLRDSPPKPQGPQIYFGFANMERNPKLNMDSNLAVSAIDRNVKTTWWKS